MLLPEEILEHCREELRRWALLPGNDCTEDEAEKFAERLLPMKLAEHLSRMTFNIEYVSDCLNDNYRNQLMDF